MNAAKLQEFEFQDDDPTPQKRIRVGDLKTILGGLKERNVTLGDGHVAVPLDGTRLVEKEVLVEEDERNELWRLDCVFWNTIPSV